VITSKTLIVAALSSLIAGAALAQAPADAIAARKASMTAMQAVLPTLRGAASTADQRRAAAKTINEQLKIFAANLPKGSGLDAGLPTRAKAEVWTDAATFKVLLDDAVNGSDKASKATDEDVNSAAAELGGSCFNCHGKYRA